MAFGGFFGIRPQGQTCVVNIYNTQGGGNLVTTATVAGAGITFPYTVSVDTDINVPVHGIYTLSVTINGIETYGKQISQANGSWFVLVPTINSNQQAAATPAMLPQSPTAVAIVTGGTIPVTNGVMRVNPTAAVTGMILAAGAYQGQNFSLINESANSITFAAAGTSRVADGTLNVVATVTSRLFVWDTGTSLWYRQG